MKYTRSFYNGLCYVFNQIYQDFFKARCCIQAHTLLTTDDTVRQQQQQNSPGDYAVSAACATDFVYSLDFTF